MSPASYRLLYIAMTPPTVKWWGVELFSCTHPAAQQDDRLRLVGLAWIPFSPRTSRTGR